MNYRDKTLIRGETLLLKVSLYTENANSSVDEPFPTDELQSILESTKNGTLPKLIAEARLSDGKTIPLTIIQDIDSETNEFIAGALTLYSDYDTSNLKGESFDVNMAMEYEEDLGFKDENDQPVMKVLKTATFNETFYIANSATDMSDRGRFADNA